MSCRADKAEAETEARAPAKIAAKAKRMLTTESYVRTERHKMQGRSKVFKTRARSRCK